MYSAGYPVLIPSSQSDDYVFDFIYARQQIIYLVWVYGDGTHYYSYSFQNCLFLVFSGIFGMVSSCFGGINLAITFLPYSITLYNLPKILLGHFSLIHFWLLLYLVNYFSILLSVSSALSLDMF